MERTALTVREAQVLDCLSQGCTYERIGDRLGMSLHTVTTHINRLRAKLERDPMRPELILTVRGAGYKMRDAPS